MIFQRHIGNKILGLVGIAALVNLLGMVLFYAASQQRTILENNEKNRRELLESIDHGLHAIMLTGSAEIARDYADGLIKVAGIAEFRFLKPDGREAFLDNDTIHQVNWRKGEELFLPRPHETRVQVLAADHPMLREAIKEKRIVLYEESDARDAHIQTFLSPVRNHKDCRRCHEKETPVLGVIKLTSSLQPLYQAIEGTRRDALLVLALSLGLLLLLTYLLLRSAVVKPIGEVTLAMNRIAEGDFTREVPVFGKDELGLMARRFNAMSERLRKTYTGLQQEQDKLATIILSAREGIIVTNRENHVVLANPAAEQLLGKSMAQIASEDVLHLFGQPLLLKRLLESGEKENETIEFNDRLLKIYAAIIRKEDGEPIGSGILIHDVTEQKKLERRLLQLSYTDQLTSLYNRRSLEETLEKQLHLARRHGYPLSIVLFDVDHFKTFNDRYGHDQGDRILSTLGALCWEQCRHTDHPCRYGGEEFCLILPHTDQEGAFILAERLRQAVEETAMDGLRITISLGIACLCQENPGIERDAFIKVADQALYQAKKAGRNRTLMSASAAAGDRSCGVISAFCEDTAP